MTAANPYDRDRLWRSSNPPWGIVRAVLQDEKSLVILDDLNGDYAEVELTVIWLTDRDQDDVEFSLDDAGFPDGSGTFMGGDDYRYDCLYGREHPGTVVPLVLGDRTIEVTAKADGWWFCVIRHDDDLMLYRASEIGGTGRFDLPLSKRRPTMPQSDRCRRIGRG